MIAVEDVYQRLSQVIDPETNLNIVDMGLIYDVKVVTGERDGREADQVMIRYTLTTPGCPLAGTLQMMIHQELADLASERFDPELDVLLELTFDPPWSLDHMSEEAKAEMGF
jgi:metal-sulfur cluster biosynthetic enzyme